MIAGGGIAAAEALIALHELAGDRVALHMVAPGHALAYKPMAVTEAFAGGPAPAFNLGELCREFDAQLHHGAVSSVDTGRRHASFNSGQSISYDALLVAVGARPVHWLDDAVTLYGPGFSTRLAGLLFALETGSVRSVAFVVPPTCGWSAPVYELALLTARRAAVARCEARLHLVTPSPRRWGCSGPRPRPRWPACSSATASSCHGRDGHRGGGRPAELRRRPEPLAVDRTVTLPRQVGPHLAGLPADADGFVPADAHGAVVGTDDVYAAGDVTSGALRQGGLAAQQADAAAETIAARAGAPLDPAAVSPRAARRAADRRSPAVPARRHRRRRGPGRGRRLRAAVVVAAEQGRGALPRSLPGHRRARRAARDHAARRDARRDRPRRAHRRDPLAAPGRRRAGRWPISIPTRGPMPEGETTGVAEDEIRAIVEMAADVLSELDLESVLERVLTPPAS